LYDVVHKWYNAKVFDNYYMKLIFNLIAIKFYVVQN